MPKKKILLLTTGGTIASHKTEYGLAPALTAEEILDFLPSMSSICHLEARNLFSIDSTNMTSAHWMQIAGAIEENFSGYDGFVILHGTDTMAYTAAALSYLIQNSPQAHCAHRLPAPSGNGNIGCPHEFARQHCLCAG